MQQTNKIYKNVKQFHTCTQTLKDIQYINSNVCQEIPNILTTPHLFYTNILMQNHNKIVFNKKISPIVNFETTNIHHHSCPSSYKLPNDLNKTIGLHTTIHIKQDMVVELCARNYVTYDGLVNGANGVFKTSTSYHKKTIIRILFPNPKIVMLDRKKFTHLYTNNIQPNWTPIEPIIKNIRIGKKSIS
jgi:hypothetical protein